MAIQPQLSLAHLDRLSSLGTAGGLETQRLSVPQYSWLFRLGMWIQSAWARLLGLFSLILILAIISSIPVFNLLGLGYLLEVSKRTAEGRSFQQVLVGIDKARLIGGALLGCWILWLPIRFISHIAQEANLVDPGGPIASRWFTLRLVVAVLVVAHLAAALMCGGKLRYFFWPLIAPFSILVWLIRRIAGWRMFRSSIRFLTQWWCPGLADDICRVTPIVDWFLPAIFFRKMGQPDLLPQMIAASWQFVTHLRLPYYFRLGCAGFVGTFAWLLIPTILLAGATLNQEGLISVSAGVLGTLLAIPIFALLPILQTQFAVTGRLRHLFDVSAAIGVFRRAPIWHLVSWLSIVVLSIPLYLLKIETVPAELLWLLSIVFLVFTLPSRWWMGWAHRRGNTRESLRRWWITVPIGGLMLSVSAFHVLVLTITRYLSWNGAFSLFENHLFLLPAPFWL